MNKKIKYVLVIIFFIITAPAPIISPIFNKYTVERVTNKAQVITPEDVKEKAIAQISEIKSKDDELSKEYANLRLNTGKIIHYSFRVHSDKVYTFGSTTVAEAEEHTVVYEFENADVSKPYIGVSLTLVRIDGQLQVIKISQQLNDTAFDPSVVLSPAKSKLDIFLSFLISIIIALSAIHYVKKSVKPRWWILLAILILTLTISIDTTQTGKLGLSVPLGVIIYWSARRKILTTDIKKAAVIS